MKLVIAEKPMLARDIARAITGKSVSESAKLPITGNGYCVCAARGHLLELKEPHEMNKCYEKWKLEDLPISFEKWEKKPTKDGSSLVSDIGHLLESADIVINAGDPDEEGQLLIDELLEYLGWKGKTYRVLVNDNIEVNIMKAFELLEDNEKYKPMYNAALARQLGDMVFGVNESRLAGLKLHKGGISVGRVQTPTLGLIVERELAMKNHESQKYYELVANGFVKDAGYNNTEVVFKFKPSKEFLSGEKYILDGSKFNEIKNRLNGKPQTFGTKVRVKVENPPLPYNLTLLQADMNKRFKLSAQDVMEVTQSLRDNHHAITYNRSDCQYLEEEHFEQAKDTLSQAMKNIGRNYIVDYSIKSKAFNDANISAHHGIIPQNVEVDVAKLNNNERRVYFAIVERYAMQFMKPAKYNVSTSTFVIEDGTFEYKVEKLVENGFKSQVKGFENEDENEEASASEKLWLEEGNHVIGEIVCGTLKKETTPPKPFTEGTLITAMSHIADYCKDPKIKEILKKKDENKKGETGGIGTTATRADIIHKLKKREFIDVDSKGKIHATDLGIDFYEILPKEIKGVDLTAKWCLIQDNIRAGIADFNAIQNSVVEEFEKHKDTAYVGMSLSGNDDIVGICPKCGQNVIKKTNSFQCESNKWEKAEANLNLIEGCGFSLVGFCGKKFSKEQAKKLLNGDELKLAGCVSKKTGKKFNCSLRLNEDGAFNVAFRGKTDDK